MAVQLPENKDAPEQPPKLVGVGERYATSDADVLGGVLLKKVANHPDEATGSEPEQYGSCFYEFAPKREGATGRTNGKCDHHAKFADGEESEESEWVHPSEVSLAIRDVHGAPKDPSRQSGDHPVKRTNGGSLNLLVARYGSSSGNVSWAAARFGKTQTPPSCQPMTCTGMATIWDSNSSGTAHTLRIAAFNFMQIFEWAT